MATVLLIGSGGREHTLAWKLAQSPKVAQVLVLPGNGGTAAAGGKISNVTDAGSSIADIAGYAVKVKASLVVVGPEQPLVDGLVDVLNDIDIPAFGPTKAAAMLEGSKAFSKDFMVRHNIPTAEHKSFSDYHAARAYIKAVKHKVVIKASGLAAGKGVLLPENKAEALEGLKQVMVDKVFGAEACKEVVVEEMMEGPEVSVLTFCDGENTVLMPGAQDHKRALDGDKGLNTGGMGAYAPAPVYTAAMADMVKKEVVEVST
jgi:phosphoribosylamine--glycine ligase/phosphoribosylformylglycinamidine cyclo-ligase